MAHTGVKILTFLEGLTLFGVIIQNRRAATYKDIMDSTKKGDKDNNDYIEDLHETYHDDFMNSVFIMTIIVAVIKTLTLYAHLSYFRAPKEDWSRCKLALAWIVNTILCIANVPMNAVQRTGLIPTLVLPSGYDNGFGILQAVF